MAPGCSGLEIDEKIDVASRRVEIAARRRAEDVEPPHMEAAAKDCDLGTTLFNKRQHEHGPFIQLWPPIGIIRIILRHECQSRPAHRAPLSRLYCGDSP